MDWTYNAFSNLTLSYYYYHYYFVEFMVFYYAYLKVLKQNLYYSRFAKILTLGNNFNGESAIFFLLCCS